MPSRSRFALALFAVLAAAPACSRSASPHDAHDVIAHASRRTLASFGSEAELKGFLTDLREAQKRDRQKMMESAQAYGPMSGAAPPGQAPPAPPAPTDSPKAEAEADSGGAESVTNVQHAGVDEGGIVKVHGEHLVVLRRGKLFTIKVGDGSLAPVSSVDAFAPDIDPSGTWYDEMLVGKDTIVVVGYSYERGGTELGLFDIDDDGIVQYRSTYHLRSNDYYSARNFASRLIGDKLVFYTPLYLSLDDEKDLFRSFPALRKWHKGASESEFSRIVSATHVYRPLMPSESLTLHTVTVCDLAKRDLTCEASAVFGPEGRVFYVSPGSVFVWVTDWQNTDGRSAQKSLVYRLPLDGSGPSVLKVAGGPVDQFSFLEDGDGHLNVLVRADSAGDAMWASEATGGEVALLRVPLESFSDGADAAPRSAYRMLPKPDGGVFQNRFVGDHVLYGSGNGWGPNEKLRGSMVAVRYADAKSPVTSLPLRHGVDRIEALGGDAIAVGSDGQDLHFTPVSLGNAPRARAPYIRKDASQGELRSHGFFYKPDGDGSGILGLPIQEVGGRPGSDHLMHESASVLFVKNDALKLTELGALPSKNEGAPPEDGCKASCVDWYGNSRPLFLRGKIYALLGYEIVEGAVDGGRIREVRRIDFTPKAPRAAR